MELVSELISYNFISVSLILGIVFMLIENRRERPHGTVHTAIIVVLLSVIVINTEIREWFLRAVYNPSADYSDSLEMHFMYVRMAAEHILFSMIAYIQLLLIIPDRLKNIFLLPLSILIIAEIVNLCGPKILFSYDPHLYYHDRFLFLLPYFIGMFYLLLLVRYSVRYFSERSVSKGTAVVFIVLLTIIECYLEAAYIVVDLLDEIVALDIIIYYFYIVAMYQSEMKVKLRTSKLELEKSKRLLTLSQIQPHFMYNSLTSIIYLCDKDSRKTKDALIDFSKYLRQNLDAMSRQELVTFEEELEHTKVYLSLERLRFDDDLSVEFDIRDKMFMLPVLSVQPIVENAVKHGINSSESGCGTVCISTEETADAHKITIRDNGAGFDFCSLDSLDNRHIGIANVRKRLEDECGGQLIIKSTPDVGTECVILIPKEIHNEDNGNR